MNEMDQKLAKRDAQRRVVEMIFPQEQEVIGIAEPLVLPRVTPQAQGWVDGDVGSRSQTSE